MATSVRSFRFGVQAGGTPDASAWTGLARRVEDLGYATLTMPDHLDRQLAPMPALQCAADATTTLRIGALVHDNDFKHPVVLAKELATLDVLSGGRLEVGLGAGWLATDYEQSGIPYDPPGVRVSRMIEAVEVMRGAWSGERFDAAGEHYTVTGYTGFPTPVQAPLPLLIGGGGPRVLRFAATHADIVGINGTLTSGAIDGSTFESMTAEAVDAKVALVRETAGDRDIELNVRAFVVMVTDDTDSALATLAELTGAPPEVVAESPFALVGPPGKLIADLRARRDRWGFSYVIVGENDVDAFAPVVAELAGT